MNKKISFLTYGFFLGILLFGSACQGGDDDNFGGDNDLNDISALPGTVLFPEDNPASDAKFELGRALFWDPVLSGAQDVACASCHHPDFGYADGRELSSGVDGVGLGPDRTGGTLVKRNSPTVLNTAFNGIDIDGNYDPSTSPMFWDNRAAGLEEQALLPILSKEEMRGEMIEEDAIFDVIVERLESIDAYRTLFENAFGSNTITADLIAKALANFQRTIIANNSPFDEYMRGDLNALTAEEIEGMNRFVQVGCANCHNGPMFSDFELHTLSVPDHPLVDDSGATESFDFRTPTLRNLAFTAPYMHNGIFDDLDDVLEFYEEIAEDNGDSQNSNVNDNEIAEEARDLNLDDDDMDEIIAFLNALNDENFDRSIPESVPSGLQVGGNIE